MKGFELTIIESDIDDSMRCLAAFPASIFESLDKLKSFEVADPTVMAVLRTTPFGFPVVTDDYIGLTHTATAESLRSIFKHFLSRDISPQAFSSAALPLLKQLRSEVEADEEGEFRQLVKNDKKNRKCPN